MSIKGFSVGGNVERYDYNSLDNLPSEITIDPALSGSSTNPVQNKVVTGAINATTDSVNALSGEVSDLKSQIDDVTSYHEPLNIFDGEFSPGYVGPNGAISQSDSYVYNTNYIPVNAGDVLTWWWYSTTTFGMRVGSVRFVCAYNSAKEAISEAGSRDTVTSYTVPSGIAYVRFTCSAKGTSKDWLMCIANATEAPEKYEAYFEPYYAVKETALPESVPIMEMVEAIDLLDGVSYTDGVCVSATSGTTREAENYMTSDYISVIGGKYLISSSEEKPAKWFTVAQYDENKVVIPRTSESASSLLLFSNASYIRISYRNTEYATYIDLILFQSLKESDYIGNHYEVKNENLQRVYAYIPEYVNESIANLSILSKTIKESPLYGKKVAWYGDSIIGNNWWHVLSDMFNMTSTGCGVGGTRISGTAAASMCQASRINGQYADVVDPNTGETTVGGVAIPLDADFIIIGAGTNDWAQSVALGDRNLQYNENWEVVEDVTTFYQACHVMFRRLCELRPNAKIIVLGTPFGRMSNRAVFTNKYGILNNQGLSTLDYGNALCEVAEMWGFNAFRYGEKIGINDNNIASLLDPTSTDGGHLHPTTDTAKKMFREATLNCLLTIKYIS